MLRVSPWNSTRNGGTEGPVGADPRVVCRRDQGISMKVHQLVTQTPLGGQINNCNSYVTTSLLSYNYIKIVNSIILETGVTIIVCFKCCFFRVDVNNLGNGSDRIQYSPVRKRRERCEKKENRN